MNNSYSTLVGLKSHEFRALKDVLSYTPDAQAAYYSQGFRPRKQSLLTKTGSFPTGVLGRVVEWLDEHKLDFTVEDARKVPKLGRKTLINSGNKPYPDQIAAVEAALKYDRGIISMPTGTGKSFIIAMLIAKLGVSTLVVVPSLEIKRQLSETLMEALGSLDNIDIENVDSNRLKEGRKYDCLIIDEAHHVAAKTYHKLNKTAWTGIYYRFFLTATPYRNQTEEQLLFEAIAGEVIFQVSYKDAIKKGYIVPVEAMYIKVPKVPTDAYTWNEVYSELVVRNDWRNQMLCALLLALPLEAPVLCLVKEIKHGQELSKLSGVPFVNGQDEETRRYIQQFNTGERTALIGTTGILGEGVDTKPAAYVIIAGLGKAKSAFLQQVGRGVRTYPGKKTCEVILFRDPSHRFLLRHYNAQVKILKEEFGITPVEMD